MNILVIISQFHPAQTPNTLRWEPLLREMLDKGHQVSVLTTKRRGRPNCENQKGITVYRAGHNTLLDKVYDLFNSKARRNETDTVSSTGGSGFLSGLTQRIVDRTWRRNYWPDGSKLFLKPGIKRGKTILADKEIDSVISVGLPFTSHLIAKALKESHPSLQWHMDIQDPFCYSKEFWVNNYEKYYEKNVEAERQAFALCNGASVTNSVAKERYSELFPEHSSKLQVIPPLFEKINLESLEKNNTYDMKLFEGKIHLTYAGSFYTGVRSIEPFLKFLSYIMEEDEAFLERVQFHFIGQLDRQTQSIISAYQSVRRNFVLHGFKNRKQTLNALLQSDILMNFGNRTDYHLPSKVVDYAYINKPLVNFISIDHDSTKVFLADTTLPVANLNLDDENYRQALENLKNFVLEERPETSPDLCAVSEFTAERLTPLYLAMTNQ